MNNQLKIQEYDNEINRLSREVADLRRELKPAPFYICTRCGCWYQSIWGCGCPINSGALAGTQGAKERA